MNYIVTTAGDCPAPSDTGVLVLSSSQYCRFRGVVRRLDGCQDKWLRNTLVVALGGFATRTRSVSQEENNCSLGVMASDNVMTRLS